MSKKLTKSRKSIKDIIQEEEKEELLEREFESSSSDSSIEKKETKKEKPKRVMSEKQLEALAKNRAKAMEALKLKKKTVEKTEFVSKKKELLVKKNEKDNRKKERELKKLENEINEESSEEEEITKPKPKATKPKTRKKKIIIENDSSDSEGDEIIIKKRSKPKAQNLPGKQEITKQIHYF